MDSQKHNIYDAFLYRYKKFILAFTYTPGFNPNLIIDDIAKTFNLQIIKLDGPSMLKPDSVFDYAKLNDQVNKLITDSNAKLNTNIIGYYGQGILIHGLNFPTKMLNFQIDLQLHFSTSIGMFLKSNTDPDGKAVYTIDDYNKFKDILDENKIHKYFNLKTDASTEVADAVFEKIIDFLEFKVYGKDYDKYSTKAKKEIASSNTTNPKPMINPKSVDVYSGSNIAQQKKEKYDELLTDSILSSVSDLYDSNPLYATKKKHTNFNIYKQMAKNTELSEAEQKMSKMELLTSDSIEFNESSDKENLSKSNNKTNNKTNNDTESESESDSDLIDETDIDTDLSSDLN
jgi:hypothetical protein